MNVFHKTLCALFLCCATLFVSTTLVSCRSKKEDKKESSQTGEGSATTQVRGGALNQFFPKEEGNFNVIYNQEKQGFVEASLKENGTEVASLAISDLVSNLQTKEKYASSSQKLAGYPMLKKGSKGTAILVGNRFQVQVRSKDTSFDESKRKMWLEKFNLAELARLQ